MTPELTALCLSGDADRDEEVIRLLRRVNADANLLAIGDITDPKVILRSLQVGADAFVDREELESEFGAAVCRVAYKQEAKARSGRLLAVVSASGGCGASTLAVNVAALLARDRGKCALIDLNPGWGDLASLLDLKPRFTLADLCLNEARLDAGNAREVIGQPLIGHPVARRAGGIRR